MRQLFRQASASAERLWPGTTSLTETIATAGPRAEVATRALAPAALPIATGSHGQFVQAVTGTSTEVAPAGSVTCADPIEKTEGSTTESVMGKSDPAGSAIENRTFRVPPRRTPTIAGEAVRPPVTLTVFSARAISAFCAFRALATIASVCAAVRAGTLKLVLNGAAAIGASAVPFTLKTTLAAFSDALV